MPVEFVVPQGHLRVAPLGALPELLRKLGGNLQPLLVALRLPGDVLDDRRVRMALAGYLGAQGRHDEVQVLRDELKAINPDDPLLQ